MSAARFLIDTSDLFRILQKEHREAWGDFIAAGVIAVCPVVELEFLYSALGAITGGSPRQAAVAAGGVRLGAYD